MSGKPEECKPLLASCPSGFSCQKTKDNKDICCTIRDSRSAETEGSNSVAASTHETTEDNQKQTKDTDPSKSLLSCQPNERLKNGICV